MSTSPINRQMVTADLELDESLGAVARCAQELATNAKGTQVEAEDLEELRAALAQWKRACGALVLAMRASGGEGV